jgi:single-strand DNA-binding protein
MGHVRSLNRVILVGRVGRDPEITHIPSLEKDVAKFSIATTEGYMNKNNEWKDITEWHNIVAWGWNAKKVEKNINRGAMVLIEGKIKSRKWKDKNDQDRKTTEIHVDNLVVLEKSNSDNMNKKNQEVDYNQNNEDSFSSQSDVESTPSVDVNSDISYDESDGDPF